MFVNPLNTEEPAGEEQLEATAAALVHAEEGVCPKCSKQMGTARILNNETVLYCSGCRVSSPLREVN